MGNKITRRIQRAKTVGKDKFEYIHIHIYIYETVKHVDKKL